MGTSKGYIAPTTPHWSTAKRAVTAFINNRDFDSKAKAASKYATAMKKICRQVVVFNRRQQES